MKKEQEKVKSMSQILTYGLLILASIIIGVISPHGIFKAVYTLLFMFIATYGIQSAVISIKPLISNATRYGRKHLKKSNLIDKKYLDLDLVKGGLFSAFMVLTGFLQIFIVNYFIQRYTGFQILDGYIIIFWSLLQLGVRLTNYFFKYKTGENLHDIKLLTNVFNETDNKGRPQINITLSAIAVISLILILKNNPVLIETPEMYLEKAEDFVLGNILPDTKIQKYKTKV